MKMILYSASTIAAIVVIGLDLQLENSSCLAQDTSPIPIRELATPDGPLGPESIRVTNDYINLGTAENVFLGRVTKNLELVPWTLKAMGQTNVPNPREEAFARSFLFITTRWDVEVLTPIKGNLSGKILLEQRGGIKGGVLYRNHSTSNDPNGAGLLEEGAAYIFFTSGPSTNMDVRQQYANLGDSTEVIDRLVRLLPQSQRRILVSSNTELSDTALMTMAQARMAELKSELPKQVTVEDFKNQRSGEYAKAAAEFEAWMNQRAAELGINPTNYGPGLVRRLLQEK